MNRPTILLIEGVANMIPWEWELDTSWFNSTEIKPTTSISKTATIVYLKPVTASVAT